jgi:hypothetical protein
LVGAKGRVDVVFQNGVVLLIGRFLDGFFVAWRIAWGVSPARALLGDSRLVVASIFYLLIHGTRWHSDLKVLNFIAVFLAAGLKIL